MCVSCQAFQFFKVPLGARWGFQLLKEVGSTVVSVGNRPSLVQFHDTILRLTGDGQWAVRFSLVFRSSLFSLPPPPPGPRWCSSTALARTTLSESILLARTRTRTRTHAHAHARTHTRTHTHTHARTPTCAHCARNLNARAREHARTHARMHTHTHARTHARTHVDASDDRKHAAERRLVTPHGSSG